MRNAPEAPSPRPRRGRRKDPLWARLTVILGAILMMVSGTVIVASKALIDRYTGNVQQANLLGSAVQKGDGNELRGVINILLLGVDARAQDPNNVRSDTVIILHVPASHDQAYLISVPRDTWLQAPAYPPSGFGGGAHKLTEIFYFGSRGQAGRQGGAQLVAQTLSATTGLRFNGAAIIDFGGFKRVIDELGGVDMCVDQRVMSLHTVRLDGKVTTVGEDKVRAGVGENIWYEKGCRRMEGWAALDYSRQRKGLAHGDYDRQRHQQQLIKAMAKEATSKGVVTDLGKLDKVVKAAGSAFVLDTGGVPIADFVFTLRGVASNDLVLLKTNNGTFNSAHLQGTSAESLSPESLEMFAAARDGTLGQFILAHPELVATDKAEKG